MSLWNLKSKHVLIVDDHQEMRSLMKTMVLPLMPESVKTAKNGKEASELLQNERFDVILCDYNLGPGRDGQQVLEEARHHRLVGPECVFIMVTAEITSDMVMGAIDYHPDDYITKPFSKIDIKQRLEKACIKKSDLAGLTALVERKQYAKALTLCESKLQNARIGRTELLKMKGELLQNLGRSEEAEKLYTDILEQRDVPWASLELGKICLKQGNHAEAEDIFRDMHKNNPANVGAIDLLADTLQQQGQYKEAQDLLENAISQSPKSIIRQRKLAQLAKQNQQLDVADKALEKAIQEGMHSCYRSPNDYTELAKSQLQQGHADSALAVLDRIEKEYKDSDEASLAMAAGKSFIYSETNNMDLCKQALDEVKSMLDDTHMALDKQLAMDLTSACLASGDKDMATSIVEQLVSNNIDDDSLIESARQLFETAGYDELGKEIISRTLDQVVSINNEGARLLKAGKLDESINFFIKAAKGMPENITINLNAAYSLIKQIEKTGHLQRYQSRAMKYLEQVHTLDPDNRKYYQLMHTLQNLSDKAA